MYIESENLHEISFSKRINYLLALYDNQLNIIQTSKRMDIILNSELKIEFITDLVKQCMVNKSFCLEFFSFPKQNARFVFNSILVLNFNKEVIGCLLKGKSVSAHFDIKALQSELNSLEGIEFSSGIKSDIIKYPGLSKRQSQALYYTLQGQSIPEISQKLGLSNRTVRAYMDDLKFKLHCNTRSELFQKATEKGFLTREQ